MGKTNLPERFHVYFKIKSFIQCPLWIDLKTNRLKTIIFLFIFSPPTRKAIVGCVYAYINVYLYSSAPKRRPGVKCKLRQDSCVLVVTFPFTLRRHDITREGRGGGGGLFYILASPGVSGFMLPKPLPCTAASRKVSQILSQFMLSFTDLVVF